MFEKTGKQIDPQNGDFLVKTESDQIIRTRRFGTGIKFGPNEDFTFGNFEFVLKPGSKYTLTALERLIIEANKKLRKKTTEAQKRWDDLKNKLKDAKTDDAVDEVATELVKLYQNIQMANDDAMIKAAQLIVADCLSSEWKKGDEPDWEIIEKLVPKKEIEKNVGMTEIAILVDAYIQMNQVSEARKNFFGMAGLVYGTPAPITTQEETGQEFGT